MDEKKDEWIWMIPEQVWVEMNENQRNAVFWVQGRMKLYEKYPDAEKGQ